MDQGTEFDNSPMFPLEVSGQVVATCPKLVEVALDSSAAMVIWGFSSEGWGTAWAMKTVEDMPLTRTAVQQDGSLRYIDENGDVEIGEATPTSQVEEQQPHLDGPSALSSRPTYSPPGPSQLPRVERGRRLAKHDGLIRAG